MNWLPLSESIPGSGNGMIFAMSCAAITHFWALLRTDRFSGLSSSQSTR